jgi:transposase
MRVAVAITLTDDEHATLQRWVRGRSVEARRVLRAKIVLAAATGQQNKEIADELGPLRKTVALWRNRFTQRRLAGIEKDAPRGGRPSTAKQKLAARIVKTTTTQTPAAATHWSTRTLAEHLCTSPSMVQRM